MRANFREGKSAAVANPGSGQVTAAILMIAAIPYERTCEGSSPRNTAHRNKQELRITPMSTQAGNFGIGDRL